MYSVDAMLWHEQALMKDIAPCLRNTFQYCCTWNTFSYVEPHNIGRSQSLATIYRRSLGPKANPTFINDSDGPAVCPALPHSALYISIVIFRALSNAFVSYHVDAPSATSLLAKGAG